MAPKKFVSPIEKPEMFSEKYIGVDGCKRGWFCTALDENQQWEVGTFSSIKDLWKAHKNAALILIDIPIGLPFEGPRACDLKARKLLGRGKTSTVFPPPCREALVSITYEEACEINKKVLGKKISLQTYHISKKIKEVDEFLLNNLNARRIIRETHPEICFWTLAGGRSMRFPKKKKQGYLERLEVLKKVFPQTESIVDAALKNYKRKEVSKDDILDSIAAAVVASSQANSLVTIPTTLKEDAMGLPMEIVYSNNFMTLKSRTIL